MSSTWIGQRMASMNGKMIALPRADSVRGQSARPQPRSKIGNVLKATKVAKADHD